MMNTQNLGSKESVGDKYIDGIYAEFSLSKDLVWKRLVFL